MTIDLIENYSQLTGQEQKALYTEGADINTGVWFATADATLFTVQGTQVTPNVPVLRAITLANNIKWIITTFRGKKVGFGSALGL